MLGLHQTEESALAAQSQLAIAGLHETQESRLAAQSQIALHTMTFPHGDNFFCEKSSGWEFPRMPTTMPMMMMMVIMVATAMTVMMTMIML